MVMLLLTPLAIYASDAIEDLTGLGLEQMRQENFSEAIYAYSRAIQLFPEGCAPPLYCRAEVYSILEYYDMAISDYTRVIKLYPGFADAYYYRSLIYAHSRDTEKANADHERATLLGSDLVD